MNCEVCDSATDGFICRACLGEIERAIGDFTSLLHEVSNVATRQTKVYRAAGQGGEDRTAETGAWDDEQQQLPAMLRSREGRIALPSTPLMVNLAARELLADAYDTLLTWASRLGADEISSTRVVAWLLTHAREIRFNEEAAEIHDELTYLHRRMTTAVDRSPSRVYAGPCQAADCGQDLYALPTSINIVCDGHRGDGVGCSTVHDLADRRDWLIGQLDTALVTIEDMIAALPMLLPDLLLPRRGSIAGWVRQGRLMPHGRNHVGEDTFVGGEMLNLIKEYRPHQYAPRPGRRAS